MGFVKQLITEELSKTSDEELKEVLEVIREELERRRKEGNNKKFEFYFEATENTAKRKNPYVARLFIKNGKLEREFKNLLRTYGKGEVTVYGNYTAAIGDIIEKRHGGSWKNEYRYWYLVTEDGQEIEVANISSSKQKQRVISYLKGEISVEELLKKEG